jgi:hypothetical protein
MKDQIHSLPFDSYASNATEISHINTIQLCDKV